MNPPIHCAQSASRGVEIYSGADCIARAETGQQAHSLALAVLIGPQRISGILIQGKRIRMHIALCALAYILEGE